MNTSNRQFPGSLYPARAEREFIRLNSLKLQRGLWYRCRNIAGEIRKKLLEQSIRQNLDRMRFALVLGHMRSGSSLLAQILGSHPEIAAYGETHTEINSASDLLRMATAVFSKCNTSPSRSRLCVDKLLHPELLTDVHCLSQLPIEWVVLLRDADATCQSLNRTFGVPLDRAEAYWEMRTNNLLHQARELCQLERKVAVITFEALTSRVENTLEALTDYLNLQTPLTAGYRFNHRGQEPGAGDPSGNLSIGKIVSREVLAPSQRYATILQEFSELPSALVLSPK